MPHRRPLLLGAVASATLFLASTALMVLTGLGPTPLDRWWASVVLSARSPALTTVQTVVSDLGGGVVGAVLVPTAVLLGMLLARLRREPVVLVVALLGSAATVQVVKHLVARPRPADQLVASDFGSFPSGHVANAATLAVLLVLLLRRRRLVAVAALWTGAMAFSRTYLQVHWLTDTLAGAALGTAVALLSVLVAERVRPAGDAATP
ncbi:MAG TPA: phosphatase PAP2 family protein [Cellulomonas sp.]